ncbi:MAG TPA: inositol 2-dehydrogenase, partial [Casimicrobiaceae bacterium]
MENPMIEVALFGAGRIGTIHAGNIARQPDVRLQYVVDVDRDAARALAGKY